MGDTSKHYLVLRDSSEIAQRQRTNQVTKGMTQDLLARARSQSLREARFAIGEYLLREPDYRQIMRWAEMGNMSPEMVLEQLSECVVKPTDVYNINPIQFSVKDGAMRSIAWDFECLSFMPNTWEPGLLICEIGFTHKRFETEWPGESPEVSPGFGPILHLNLHILKTLFYQSLYLDELNLSQAPCLTRLYCGDNDLYKLDLTLVPNLTHLDFSFNKISKLDLTLAPKLTHLDCSDNELYTLNLTSVSELKYLKFSSNELRRIDLTPVPYLTHLDCARNTLSELDLTHVPNLTYLDCAGNILSELDLTHVPNLTYLDCAGNILSELDLTAVPNLTHLRCDKNLGLHNAPDNLEVEYQF